MDKEPLFKQGIVENKDSMYRICFAYKRDPDERQDLYQEIVINIWKNLGKFEGRSMISTWIYRIAVNTSLMHIKKESRRNRDTTELNESIISNTADNISETEEKIETGKNIEKLYSSINELPSMDRVIISMVLEELSYKEIAEVTGLTVNNIGVRINRIKKELSRLMEEKEDGI